MTVETAMIMPMVFLVIAFVVCLGLYEYDTSVFIEKSFFASRRQSMYGSEFELKKEQLSESSILANNAIIKNQQNMTAYISEANADVKLMIFDNILKIYAKQGFAKCYAPAMIRMVNIGLNVKDTILEGK